MHQIRKFLVTSSKLHEGTTYSFYKDTEILCGFEIQEASMTLEAVAKVTENCKPHLALFLSWVKSMSLTCVELQQQITFEMFWDKYNDKDRSSKKRSRKLWDKLVEEEQVKAYYYYDRYNRNRGNAEKKYCETYLSAEMWNN